MPFVKRGQNGKIIAVSLIETEEFKEKLSLADPVINEFLIHAHHSNHEISSEELINLKELRSSDLEFVRVLEDVIYLLLEKNIFMITDLPPEAILRLRQRERIRKKLHELNSILAHADESEPQLNLDKLYKQEK